MRKICVVTGSRAEYGLLLGLMAALKKRRNLRLQVVVTGMHLAPEFGLTYRQIEKDGFLIDEKVEMQLSSDTPVGTSKSIGLGIIGFADAFARLRPDLLVVLGDRYEIFAAAQAAMIAKIPIAHIAGGDVTEGAFDEAIRHSITKMSQLHFVTNSKSWQRVRQLGENPAYIFNVGHIGLDLINTLPRMSRAELERDLGIKLYDKNLLITFHPVTLDAQPSEKQFTELLAALKWLGDDIGLIFTHPNADPEGRRIICQIEDFIVTHPNAVSFPSLGQLRYYSIIGQVDAVVGNSSSGVYEVPSFHKPTVNIGDRQKGRLFAPSVICCPAQRDEIFDAIQKALQLDCTGSENPYGNGGSIEKTVGILGSFPDFKSLIKKQFYEVTQMP
ncbi:UDP-N-acetylglucosamine 2-epimerase [Oscillospiraceae bacterium LTW-04]|nr:UDP-N-acetylglucosamine 2-epimerase [Oscillospiraceae bacterium MB24-C1]